MAAQALITILIAVFGSTGLWEFLKWLIANKRKKKTAEQEALLTLLQIQLYPIVEKIYFRGVIGYDEALNLEQLYNSYRRLDGNSTIKSRYELIAKFERVKDEELEAYDSGIVRKDLLNR